MKHFASSVTTQESTVAKLSAPACRPLTDTFELMLREQLPNFLRLYLNPYVSQTCFCLDRYVKTTWRETQSVSQDHQSFLANSFDEALSGAIKLARYSASHNGKAATGLIYDATDRLGPFASVPVIGGRRVELLPGLVIVGQGPGDCRQALATGGPFGFVVLLADEEFSIDQYAEELRQLIRRDAPMVIICVDHHSLARLRTDASSVLRELDPDVVVFDESFVDRAVPFGAFTARKEIYEHWNRPGKTTFHSTTYQPNTVSSLHFMKCLETLDQEFFESCTKDLENIATNLEARRDAFRRLYSPSLCRLIRASGFESTDVRSTGDYAVVNGRRILDAVAGVACSIRGHNPAGYANDLAEPGPLEDCRKELTDRLQALTGFEHALPGVSGASAVENALRIALVARFPKRHILALKAGFGGKTLLALSGTANPAYKQHIEPLYPDVSYIDPFATDAEEQIDAVLQKYSVAVVQLELVQAVGGVRQVPERVVTHLEERRQKWGYLLLVDEVQTGMFRTGRFTLSGAMGLTPDLLLLGKGTSDMMFPFALLLYRSAVQDDLERMGSDLPCAIEKRYGYEFGFRTVLNVLRFAESATLSKRVIESGSLFAKLLNEGLAGCKAVRSIRVYGLLIGIELERGRGPRRWLGKRLFWFYLFAMLRHKRNPILVGFCQYEPNVLKITPALTITPGEIQNLCKTIIDVLHLPMYRLLATVLGGLVSPSKSAREKT
jgi:acetylornithine/succinyldiaminopimelate/putrescine aminotransferase